ncbi:oxidoreductase [Paraburkholderia edwinii]|jgi:NAD(P)-dependent dehydrogenase (short-subunit alcohol dehydrogenase family)|uniref:Oxidoreductase n=1 Tax=Paraburkholderia edwinii TaxID=2861782 RepID=A0ABX8UMJ8_9BURK|nr:oxidoreductase [Paraburkholderia edwinii]QYD70069.1 oxidoreductase [Paraburkholderia edwinii]
MIRTNTSRTFFITGVSSGFGRALSEAALAAGHRVVGTLRDESQRAQFDELKPGYSFGRLLDITDLPAIAPLIDEVERNVGPIDVLVNNAGYGYEGTIEESPVDELRKQMEVHVIAPVAIAQAVLPFMRERRQGHIVNITSMCGIVTFPGLGFYHGSKFAIEGITEALCKEVRPFGIRVTAVEPGSFRTRWAGKSMVRAARTIADYDEVFEPLRAGRIRRDGHQIGDPAKAAQAILALVDAQNPPTHLLLGTDALGFVRSKFADVEFQIKTWEKVTLSTDFED